MAEVRWPSEAIWEAVVPDLPGFSVEVLPAIDSTNTELMRRARAGRIEPVLLVAECQTAGRGRLGRDWHSDTSGRAGTLTFSLGLVMEPPSWSGLSLVSGLALARALHPAIQLKWPNDLWWQDRKLGGILIETLSVDRVRYAVIGVGINIRKLEATGHPANPASAFATPAAALEELDPTASAPGALQAVVTPLVWALRSFMVNGFGPSQAEFHQRDALRGRYVVVSDGTTGAARGVDASGALLVQTAHGVRHVGSAEVSVRPMAAEALCP